MQFKRSSISEKRLYVKIAEWFRRKFDLNVEIQPDFGDDRPDIVIYDPFLRIVYVVEVKVRSTDISEQIGRYKRYGRVIVVGPRDIEVAEDEGVEFVDVAKFLI